MVPVDPHGAHLSAEQIALRALGEPAADTEGVEDAHLDRCAECSRELGSLRAVVGIARDPAAAGRGPGLVAPPAQVWDGIRAELGLGRDAGQVLSPGLAPQAPPRGPAPQAPPSAGLVPVTPLGAPRRRTRGRTAWIALAAAIAGVAAGAGADALLRDRGSATGGEVVLARASLAPLPARTGSGSAVLERSASGLRLVVTTSGLDALDNGFHEVWLLDAGTSRLLSLGVLAGDSGSFPVPSGVDVAQYPLVDVSDEPLDGDPSHSSESVIRGELRA